MKQVTVRCIVLFLLSLAGLSFGLQVTGVVVDSTTRQPVQDAKVLLLDTNQSIILNGFDMNKLQFDSMSTASNGSFSLTVGSNMTIFYSVVKAGYAVYINYCQLLQPTATVRLDTIRLVPLNLAAKDTLNVSGKVIDSATRTGIPGALIGMSGADLDTVGKTVIADANGNFSSKVVITKVSGLSMSIIGYIAYKQGYSQAMGTKLVLTKVVNLSTISLLSTSVRWTQRQAYARSNPTGMALYSLNGRMLYSGRVAPLNRVIDRSTSAVLVEFRHNGSIVDRKKIMPVR
jgi:hypothetical protein